MKLHDNNGYILKISSSIGEDNNIEKAYLLKGVFDNTTYDINITECLDLKEYTDINEEYKIEINKKFLYSSIKGFSEENYVYILVHTHPFQEKSTLGFSPVDNDFFESLCDTSLKMKYSLPLVFGVVCKDSVIFKIYNNKEIIIQDNFDTPMDEYDSASWDIKVLSDSSLDKAAIYHKKSNSMLCTNIDNANMINEWQMEFKSKKLSPLQEIAFKYFIFNHFSLNTEKNLLSNESFRENKSIFKLEFMIQLGCNLKCKYCYADEGTYGASENIVLKPDDARTILNNLINNGISEIKNITFFGGEPSEYPETILAICEHCETLYKNKKLVSVPEFYIVTNGTILKQILIDTIKKYNIKMTISLDGPEHINDEVRIDKNNNGTYKRVSNNLLKLRENNIEPVMIESTYTKIHEDNGISRESLINIMKKKFAIPTIYVADCSDSEYSPISEQLKDDFMIERINKTMSNFTTTYLDIETLSLINTTLQQLNSKSMSNNLHCGAGYNMMAIGGNGDYYPCHRFFEDEKYKLGNLLDNSKSLNSDSILTKDNINSCIECWAGQFCNGCTWDLITKQESTLSLCKEKCDMIKNILIRFINLDESEKYELKNKTKLAKARELESVN